MKNQNHKAIYDGLPFLVNTEGQFYAKTTEGVCGFIEGTVIHENQLYIVLKTHSGKIEVLPQDLWFMLENLKIIPFIDTVRHGPIGHCQGKLYYKYASEENRKFKVSPLGNFYAISPHGHVGTIQPGDVSSRKFELSKPCVKFCPAMDESIGFLFVSIKGTKLVLEDDTHLDLECALENGLVEFKDGKLYATKEEQMICAKPGVSLQREPMKQDWLKETAMFKEVRHESSDTIIYDLQGKIIKVQFKDKEFDRVMYDFPTPYSEEVWKLMAKIPEIIEHAKTLV
jgi:hypothetical protein